MSKEMIDEIKNFYMNPDKYPNDKKKSVKGAIERIDSALMTCEQCEELEALCSHYTSKASDSLINTHIRQCRADEEGIRATKGYNEIYFNEIIQNANDCTDGEEIEIGMALNDGIYSIAFRYRDTGFRTENIIGLFNTEMHTKRKKLSATGKHGVGIKALFYFVDYLRIESNIIAEFVIDTIDETDDEGDVIEKISEVKSSLTVNKEWEKGITSLTIRFKEKENYGGFNVKKLKKFVRLCHDKEKVQYDEVKSYFFSNEQERLIFDARALLFTDKNRNKEHGIRVLRFFNAKKEALFSIGCDAKEGLVTASGEFRVEQAKIKFDEMVMLSYTVFTYTDIEQKKEQNFSVAFPKAEQIDCNGRRYYETYYIPDPSENDRTGLNLLINSKYSSVDRRSLTDDRGKEEGILTDIERKLVIIYRFMVSKECQDAISDELKMELSKVFHTMLEKKDDFISLCYEYEITNKYLVKHKDTFDASRFISYRRKEKEAYEKKVIGQKYTKEDIVTVFNKVILQEDSIVFDKEKNLRETVNVYEKAFNGEGTVKLRKILNVAGTIEELVYYRVHGDFPQESEFQLNEAEIDAWTNRMNENSELMRAIIGRYRLHRYINENGEINGASFYEYLFHEDSGSEEETKGAFALKQKELFDDKYRELKQKLLKLRVNSNQSGTVSLYGSTCDYQRGEIAFYASWDLRANSDTYYNQDHCKIIGDEKLDMEYIGSEYFELLLEKIVEELSMRSHITKLQEKLMLSSLSYPTWGKPSTWYGRNGLLRTGRWFTSTFINLDFMRRMQVKEWEKFQLYVSYLLENHEIFQKWEFTIDANCSIPIVELLSVFRFYYEKKITEQEFLAINLRITLTECASIPELNLCKEDFFEYLKRITGLKVCVLQTNAVSTRKKEVLYVYDKKINLLMNGVWYEIGDEIENEMEADQVLILHNENSSVEEAICKVLEEILDNKEILEKCKAFLPANQVYSIQGPDYDELKSVDEKGNLREQKYSGRIISNEFTSKQLVKLITARGNNNQKCCCCGKVLKNGRLVITNNEYIQTKAEYPQIIEVVCELCEDVLRKSHKCSYLIREEDGYYVEYHCEVQNTHQSKDICWKYKICEGVRALCSVKK